MINVTLIGTGNMASHLFNAFYKSDKICVIQVMGRNAEALTSFEKDVKTSADFSKAEKSDVYIIAVKDDAITSVAEKFAEVDGMVVHTSGTVALEALPSTSRRGVFYPLQTLSKTQKVDFATVPICIEAEKTTDLDVLRSLASAISNQVTVVGSEQRKSLHLAAVFVNNFTNHIYQIGKEICAENKLSFDLLKPLITETAKKIETLAPIDAQTGPARRNDTATIESHLSQLKKKNQHEIYTVLTKSIIKMYGEKL